MAAASPDSRDEQIAALAGQFVAYLRQGTDVELDAPGAVSDAHGPAALLDAVERLDLALAQLVDLASVYDDGASMSLESLVLPAAALMGEYLRVCSGASWLAPDPDDPAPDDSLAIVTSDGIAIDLLGAARATLLSGAPNLRSVVERLLATS
ncbi:MAG TPA: hypothetical protein VFV93_13285 [Thermomicrobiales bacterium]|nr:hypothetical protein [Thermomicrobiales bacterium]